MAEVVGGQTLSPREYASLIVEYHVQLRAFRIGPSAPVWYGRVTGRNSGELIGYMWYNAGREEWILYPPEAVTDEILDIFDL